MSDKRLSSQPALTLAETLIALTLVAVVAAFVIPKIMQAGQDHEKSAKLKELVATLESAWYDAKQNQVMLQSGLLSGSFHTWMRGRLNVLRETTDPTNNPGNIYVSLSAHPCSDNWPWMHGYFQFPNGIVLSGTSGTTFSGNPVNPMMNYSNAVLCIDLNGAALPNQAGDDVFLENFNISGDFDNLAGPAFTTQPLEHSKNFHWGSASIPVYDYGGAALPPAFVDSKNWVGTYLK